MEQRLFVRCNACGVHAAPFDCAMPYREAGQRVSHWPCSEQEHGHWVAVLLLAHDWGGDAWSGATCKRCGAWASTMKPIPRYGCVPPGETLPVVVREEHEDYDRCDGCGYPLDDCRCHDIHCNCQSCGPCHCGHCP